MSRNEQCFCGSGKKQKKCHDDVDPNSYIGNLYKKYFKIDSIISDYKATHKEFENHPCGKGCFNCCYDVFPISMLEFELLLEEIRNIGIEFAEAVFAKALKHLDGSVAKFEKSINEWINKRRYLRNVHELL
ncbi:SEC-C metal-binding domain-containing protein [Bacillus cereus]|uniref:SEC-C metal-binding domain-containing protein n=1 Tax=Bacillus cereus TaxID=1396 RepID=UPI0020D26311|nr:SEC-C metal-binding domain-containing protein [Bacillus cereus]